MTVKTLHIILFCSLFYSFKMAAQLRAVNIMEYQYGNIPDVEPSDLNTLYNQLSLSYRYNKLSASSRLELFSSSYGNNYNYIKPTQLKLSYNTRHIRLDAGHLYSTLGRGLLMRNYEIPASILETRGYRVRHAFFKDMEGFSAQYKSTHFNAKILRGKTLTVDLPPTLKNTDRRLDLIEAIEVNGAIENQLIGLIYMGHENNTKNHYLSGYYNGTFKNLSVYGEVAKRVDSLSALNTFTEEESWGSYLGINYTYNNFGISAEYKAYNSFLIGNGVNEPPTLIKEHQWVVLNRSTHVPLIDDEKGYQLEVFYSFENGNTLVANHALSNNNIAGNEYTFKEFHLDYSASINEKLLLRSFINYSQAPLVSEVDRFALGTLTDIEHRKHYSSSIGLEYQQIKRDDGFTVSHISNGVVSYTLSRSNRFSGTLLFETTNDPFHVLVGNEWEYYPSATFSYQVNRKYKLAAFVGKRRGGPACTSGICYEVLDFKGAELRFTSRFL